jgi:4-carboxymuconolactone decarboxylase
VFRSLNNGMTQPTLESMRREFPFLAEATEAYTLGDVWSRPCLDNRTRQLAAVAAFAAIGETAFMRAHAGYALNIGVSQQQLKEVIYMVTVPAGFPKAIAASRVLSQLLEERRQADVAHPPNKDPRRR